MRVIGAGLPRTGTMTMQAALKTLGYPCYHMKEVPRERGHLDAWYQFVTGQAPMDWHTLFRNFEATVDTPGCLYYQELMEAFPDAKVVLTVREPDRWYASLMTLYRTFNTFRPVARVEGRATRPDRSPALRIGPRDTPEPIGYNYRPQSNQNRRP